MLTSARVTVHRRERQARAGPPAPRDSSRRRRDRPRPRPRPRWRRGQQRPWASPGAGTVRRSTAVLAHGLPVVLGLLRGRRAGCGADGDRPGRSPGRGRAGLDLRCDARLAEVGEAFVERERSVRSRIGPVAQAVFPHAAREEHELVAAPRPLAGRDDLQPAARRPAARHADCAELADRALDRARPGLRSRDRRRRRSRGRGTPDGRGARRHSATSCQSRATPRCSEGGGAAPPRASARWIRSATATQTTTAAATAASAVRRMREGRPMGVIVRARPSTSCEGAMNK